MSTKKYLSHHLILKRGRLSLHVITIDEDEGKVTALEPFSKETPDTIFINGALRLVKADNPSMAANPDDTDVKIILP